MQIIHVHPLFCAEINGIDIAAPLEAATLVALRDALDRYGVVVIPAQERLDDDAQIAFCQNFGTLQTSITLHRKDAPRRMTRDELTELSNIDVEGRRISPNDTKRQLQLPGRLWHSDNSFRSPPGLFTFLHARVVPPEGGNTEFADMRAAYDELDTAMKARITGLTVVHSLARSRELVGAPPLSPEERVNLPDTIQPLVRVHPSSGRKSLYLSSHARDVVGMDEREGQALLTELTEHATQARFVYSHKWSAGDMVIWDNRCTMHRATPFPEDRYRRDMRRTSVADKEAAVAA